MPRRPPCWLTTRWWRSVRGRTAASSPARFRTTSSRSTSRAAPIFIRRGRRCASSPTSSRGRPARCRSGIPFRSADITYGKPARPPPRNWRSPSPTPSPTARRRWRPVWRWMPSRRGFRSSSTRTTIFWRRSPSSARRIYVHLMRDRFGAKDTRSQMLRFHVQTAGTTLTPQQPDVNLVRTALQALAAVLGGAQSLHTNSRDEALALPTEESARIALRTQQIVAYESGVTNTVDPVGGSQCIEELTDSIERGVHAYLKSIEEAGGTLRAIETGYIQNQIQNAAYDYQRGIESGQRVV